MVCPSTIGAIACRVSFVDDIGGNQVNNVTINPGFNFLIHHYFFDFHNTVKRRLRSHFITQADIPNAELNIA